MRSPRRPISRDLPAIIPHRPKTADTASVWTFYHALVIAEDRPNRSLLLRRLMFAGRGMNYFDSDTAAARYARGRPYYHTIVIERIARRLGITAPVDLPLARSPLRLRRGPSHPDITHHHAAMTGPLSSGQFRYLFLHVVDLEEMLRFYRDGLGLVVSYYEKDLCAFLRLRVDDPFDLALFVGRESAIGAEPDRFPAIDVASLDDAVAELRRRGVDAGEITETAIGRYVKLYDPEGNVVEIHQGNPF